MTSFCKLDWEAKAMNKTKKKQKVFLMVRLLRVFFTLLTRIATARGSPLEPLESAMPYCFGLWGLCALQVAPTSLHIET